jgi:2',3'-cyclic-nucleotide 2'-phosphodiesterase/3'-nucleotidase
MTRMHPDPQGKLRILETTDLHMHLLGYDYFADRADDTIGLGMLADVIAAQRAKDTTATLLFDNGDFLQGNPLADHIAETLATGEVHPLAAAMNMLRYDAVTLGNHDFDYGLPFLRSTLGQIECAKVSANVQTSDGAALAARYVILPTPIVCSDGATRTLRVGVTGFAPPQMAELGSHGQGCSVQVSDIIATARVIVPQIKAAGADIIVALCHSGIGAAQATPLMENAVLPLAGIAGIDVILAGHTHEFFPDLSRSAQQGIDPIIGRIGTKPAVMAGYYGCALGVVELDLQWTNQRWQVDAFTAKLERPCPQDLPPSHANAQISALADRFHRATLNQIRQPVAQTMTPIHSYFATVMPDLSQQLLATAMGDAARAALNYQGPILAAVSPFRFGGRAGPGHYLDVPVGPIARKDTVAIFPFADTLSAVHRTGAQIRDWLERSASHYNQITAGKKHQPLINPQSAGYNCDAIYGLQYAFDLTKPARFDTDGNLVAPHASRVVSLSLNGKDVADTDVFVVAANSFRIKGGGRFPSVPATDLLWSTQTKLRDVLVASLKGSSPVIATAQPVWRFHPVPHTSAQFQSARAAIPHTTGNIRHDGPTDDGFDTFSLIF